MVKDRQKGLALIFVLALMLILSAIVAASFLGMSRQQRMVQQSVHRLELESTARSIMDYAHKFFVGYIQTNAVFPPYDSTSKETYSDRTRTVLVKTFLENWFAGLKANPESETAKILSGLTLVSISVQLVQAANEPPSDLDAWRRYEIAVKIRDDATGTEHYGKQTIRVSCGGLFDFMAFFDGDLEIGSGPDTTIQGPLFSNGNIYLMSDAGKTLNLKMPAGTSSDKYILRTAKNIYYYFKRAIGQNYFLASPAGLHQSYKNAAANIRTQLASEIPYPGYGEKNNLEIYPNVSGNTIWEKQYAPYFYYFTNGAAYSGSNIVNLVAADGTTLLKKLAGPFPSIWTGGPWTMFVKSGSYDYPASSSYIMNMSPAWDVRHLPQPEDGWNYEDPVTNVSYGDPAVTTNWPYNSSTTGGVPISVGVPRRTLPFGDSTGSGGENPNHNLIEPLKTPCSVNASGICIPQSSCDCPELAALKFESTADILIKCSNDACTSYAMTTSSKFGQLPQPILLSCNAEAGSNCLTYGWGEGAKLYDYRIGASVPGLTLDMDALRRYVQGLSGDNKLAVDPDKNGLIIYIETRPVKDPRWTSDSIRVVRLKNGQKGPALSWTDDGGTEKTYGFTVVTNGRLWIQGNFNTWSYSSDGSLISECSYADLVAGVCSVPPASIFSDSIGLLSNNWSDAWGASTSLTTRSVTGDVNVYAALVTGYLYSQLYPVYPACLTKEIEYKYISGTANLKGSWDYCSPFTWSSGAPADPTTNTYNYALGDTSPGSAYDVALNRPDNKWPIWAKKSATNPTPAIPYWIAGPKITWSPGCMGNGSVTGGYKNTPLGPVTNYMAGGDTPPVAAPPFPGIRRAGFQSGNLYGGAFAAYRCNNGTKVYKQICAVTGTGEATGTSCDQGACRVSDTDPTVAATDSKILACPEDTSAGGLKPCNQTNYPIDSEGFLKSEYPLDNPGSTSVQFDYNSDGIMETLYQVKWTTALGWPGSNPAQNDYKGALVYINMNDAACFEMPSNNATGKFSWYRYRWPVLKSAVDGKYYFLYDNAEYNCSGVTTPSIATKPGNGNLEPMLRPNRVPAPWYYAEPQLPLYETRYSGGLENIVNLQEDWAPVSGTRSFNFSGVLTSPWSAEELYRVDTTKDFIDPLRYRNKAFYATTYYRAPKRNFDYSESFLGEHPPGTPGVYGVVREKYDDLTGQ